MRPIIYPILLRIALLRRYKTSIILYERPYKITSSISGLSISKLCAVVAIRIQYEGEISPFLVSFKILKSAVIEVLEALTINTK
jgi:hypothetical protein